MNRNVVIGVSLVLVGLVCRAAIEKALAISSGAQSVALYAQYQSLSDLVAAVTLVGIGQGLTVLAARGDYAFGSLMRASLSRGMALSGLFTLLLSGLLYWLYLRSAGQVSGLEGRWMVAALLVGFVGVGPGLFLAYWQGKELRGRMLMLTSLGYVFPLAIAWGGFAYSNVANLITATLFTQIFLFLILVGSYKDELLQARDWKQIPLRQYLAPGISIGVLSPLSLLWVRGEIAATLSWESVAQLQALWRISEWVIGVSSNVLFLIFLPALVLSVAQKEFVLVKKKIWRKVFLPAAMVLLMMALAQRWVVPMFYSDQFVMPWMAGVLFLLGDVIRVGSWVHLLGLFAKERVMAITIGEWLSLPLFAVAVTLVKPGSLEGVAVLYVASYLAYFAFNWKANHDSAV